eukprot:scaffold47910_cov51-Phaeocystis_antarctica.AAC.2
MCGRRSLSCHSCSLAAIASLDQSWPPSLAGSVDLGSNQGSTGSGLAGLGPDSRAGSGQDLLGVAVG